MFFRRQRPTPITFQERLDNLKRGGFSVTPRPDGSVLVGKGECAVSLRESDGQVQRAELAGILMCGEIASLVDGGYQKFFRTPSGKSKPALASELKALHEFEEDLKEGLGLESLYNESLGTVSTYYLYDRVKDRDGGVPKRVWAESNADVEKALQSKEQAGWQAWKDHDQKAFEEMIPEDAINIAGGTI